ncbi:MAG: thioredoxin-dependent thiol peroxidase [Gemmatimonadales bacterium]
MFKPGSKAPAFSLSSDKGGIVSLTDLKGTKVVLYFYPKDDTSGCTVEACEFRGSWKAVQAAGATVLGVSPDSTRSHQTFKRKYRLPFPLLSDPDHAVAAAYGAWGEKSMYGRKYMGILRSTVVIDEKGRVLHHFEKVRPKGHAAEVLAVLHADVR